MSDIARKGRCMKAIAIRTACGLAFLAAALLCVAGLSAGEPPEFSWRPAPASLPEPVGAVVHVCNTDELFRAVATSPPKATILIADGVYSMPRCLVVRTDGLVLRSRSQDRSRVVLDGKEHQLGELLALTACRDVTIADLTVRNVRWNGIKINSETNVQNVLIRNCVIHNIWQRGVKGVKVPPENRDTVRPTGCRIEHCLFYNDRPKQLADDPADTAENFDGNYLGGIDVMYARDWVIADNIFWNIRGRTGTARGAVFLWFEAENCVVERNIIVDCDSGICFGNAHRPADVPIHAVRCVARHNFLARVPENGILAFHTRDCRIEHNTVHDPASKLGRLIRAGGENDGLHVVGNLLDGPRPAIESTSKMRFEKNAVGKFTHLFVDAARGDLRLREPLPGDPGAQMPTASGSRQRE